MRERIIDILIILLAVIGLVIFLVASEISDYVPPPTHTIKQVHKVGLTDEIRCCIMPIDGALIRSHIPGYYIRRIYLIICDKCNEEITRSQGGDDIEYLTEAREYIDKHNRVWHS